MVHPFALAGVIVAKKVVAYALYKGIQRYGVGNAYRRVLRLNKQLTPSNQQRKVQSMVKAAFYAPSKIAVLLQDAEGNAFYRKALHELRTGSSTLYALFAGMIDQPSGVLTSLRTGILDQLQSMSKSRPSTPG